MNGLSELSLISICWRDNEFIGECVTLVYLLII